jgi:tripartite-type tricarboxylate transporter receptor subunit TctC
LVCFPPGGSTDTSARLLQAALGDSLGKPVVIENRPGAGGNIGIAAAARAQPDGYTFLVASSVFVVNTSLYRNPPYDPFRDFAPVAGLSAAPNIIGIRRELAITSIDQLIADAKANPTKYNYASPGFGTTPHLAGEVLKFRTGMPLQHIPFAGAGPAVQAVLSGAVELLIASQGGQVETSTRSGAIRLLAQTGATRSPEMPDVPTLGECGIADAVSETFNGLYAPAGVPEPIITRLASASLAALARPEVRERYRLAGVPVIAEDPATLRARVAREVPLWREVIRRANITVE